VAKRTNVLTLKLTDVATGARLLSAKLTVNYARTNGDSETVELKPDAQGRCAVPLDRFRFDRLHVVAHAEGFVPRIAIWRAGRVPAQAELKLAPPPPPVALEVRTPLDAPASGASIQLAADAKVATADPPAAGLSALTEALEWQAQVESARRRYGYSTLLSTAGPPPATGTTDSAGRFAFSPTYCEAVVIRHDSGYAVLGLTQLQRPAHRATLVPWARLEGRLRVGRNPGTNQELRLRAVYGDATRSSRLVARATPDPEGRFAIEHVAAGRYDLERVALPIDTRRPVAAQWLASVELEPGQSMPLDLGGTGRALRGQVRLKGGSQPERWWGELVAIRAGAGADADPGASQVPAGVSAEAAARRYGLRFDAAGRFQLEDLPPGGYWLQIQAQQAAPGRSALARYGVTEIRVLGAATNRLDIPVASSAGQADDPVDAGVVEVAAASAPIAPGP
jgi:hypothetical protein